MTLWFCARHPRRYFLLHLPIAWASQATKVDAQTIGYRQELITPQAYMAGPSPSRKREPWRLPPPSQGSPDRCLTPSTHPRSQKHTARLLRRRLPGSRPWNYMLGCGDGHGSPRVGSLTQQIVISAAPIGGTDLPGRGRKIVHRPLRAGVSCGSSLAASTTLAGSSVLLDAVKWRDAVCSIRCFLVENGALAVRVRAIRHSPAGDGRSGRGGDQTSIDASLFWSRFQALERICQKHPCGG